MQGQGSKPEWNEKFTFKIEYPSVDGQYKLILKLMDHDTFSADDYLGDATIYLKEFIELGLENGRVENLKFILKNIVWWAVLNVTVVKFNLASLSPQRRQLNMRKLNMVDGNMRKLNMVDGKRVMSTHE